MMTASQNDWAACCTFTQWNQNISRKIPQVHVLHSKHEVVISAEYFKYQQYFMQYFMQWHNHSKSTVNDCDVITFILFVFVGVMNKGDVGKRQTWVWVFIGWIWVVLSSSCMMIASYVTVSSVLHDHSQRWIFTFHMYLIFNTTELDLKHNFMLSHVFKCPTFRFTWEYLNINGLKKGNKDQDYNDNFSQT